MLKSFLDHAGNSLQSFRYFNSRPLDVVKNHVCTELLVDDTNTPIAYGHLDTENETIWLGTVVSETYTGKGLGKLMMAHLIDQAKKKQVKRIRLSVDNKNLKAINLYTSFGFKQTEKKETISFYELNLIPVK
jgi:GNAT superfamily N-acetyltransferase